MKRPFQYQKEIKTHPPELTSQNPKDLSRINSLTEKKDLEEWRERNRRDREKNLAIAKGLP